MPSGKVYKLNADATAKQDEASATVVFDAGELDGSDAASDAAAKGDDPKLAVTLAKQNRTTSGI